MELSREQIQLAEADGLDVNRICEPLTACLFPLENGLFQWAVISNHLVRQKVSISKGEENFGPPVNVGDHAASYRV